MKLSERLTAINPSVTLQITAKAKELKAKGEDVISFGAGEPDFDTPEYIKQAGIDAIHNGVTKYTVATGTAELKEAIVKKLKEENNIEYSMNQIIVSNGAKHSLYNAFRAVLNEGDEVILPVPYWVSYPDMIQSCGGVVVPLETSMENGYKIDPAELKKKITSKTKAIVLNSPSNPTGGLYTEQELLAIANEAVAGGFFIISDEIYEKLVYDGLTFTSVASLSEDIKKHTITINGMSKAFSMTGWRIGYLAADPAVTKAIAAFQSHTTSNPVSFSQSGAVAALTEKNDAVEMMRQSFEKRRNMMYELLSDIDGIEPFKPQGAFYMFCDISKTGMKAMEFSSKLLQEKQVAVIPGEAFGTDKCVRLSFATSEENIKKGIARIKEWLAK